MARALAGRGWHVSTRKVTRVPERENGWRHPLRTRIPNGLASHLIPGSVCRIVARHAEAAGLDTVGTHDLRRSFAGWLDEDGVDLAGIQAALRHSTPGVTVSCY
ncbi:tyrosine-type recombinase/integrase [Ilumatobacter fluminis]|uniref:tyrosine-type recombinase/integrase n=1 Tax=Ilumatobacter fluminis TaxID=467091 RepID=UPI0032EF090E